jgi:hypothetical protein
MVFKKSDSTHFDNLQPTTEYRRQIYQQQVTTGRHVLVVDMAFFRRADGYYAVSWEVPGAALQAVCGYQFAFRCANNLSIS